MKRHIATVSILVAVTGCAAPDKPQHDKKDGLTGPKQAATVTSFAIKPDGEPTTTRLKVGTEIVSASDLWKGLKPLLASRAASMPTPEFRKFVEERSAQIIVDKIAEMLLYQRATLRFTEQMEKTIDRFVDAQIRETVTADFGGVQRRYEKQLEKDGTSLDTVRQQLRREFVIASFLENEVKPKLDEPTRAELFAMYESDAQSRRKAERRNMALIEVRVIDHLPPDVTEPSRDELGEARTAARLKINAALAELQAGGSFADVARKHSGGLRASEGGAWGFVGKGSVRERYEPAVEVLYKVEKGAFSEVIETSDGFFIVRCEEIEGGADLSFEAAQPGLRDRFSREQYNKLIGELVIQLRQNTTIEPANLDIFHRAVVDAALEMTPPPVGP